MSSKKLIFCLMAVACVSYNSAEPVHVGAKNIRFLSYPDFPEADSSWGSIGFSFRHNKVYVGVTNHHDRQGLFEYDVAFRKLRLCGFIAEMAHLRPFQWQGKIHTQIVEGPDGAMYFGSDGGESREEDLKEHPTGYGGGFFFRWDPDHGELSNLGMGLPYEGLKDLAVDRKDGTLFAVSYPQVHLLTYDVPDNRILDLGRVGSGHVPRVLFTDWWGNIYYVDWRQRLIEYEHDSKRLLFCRESLPAFNGTPGYSIITGITAWAGNEKEEVIYLITYGAKMLAFHPRRRGIGAVEDLGGIYDDPDHPPWDYYCPNLALHKNGKLYYFIGATALMLESARALRSWNSTPKHAQSAYFWPGRQPCYRKQLARMLKTGKAISISPAAVTIRRSLNSANPEGTVPS